MDVFDLNGGVIDKNADRQRKATQGHDIYGLAQRAQDNDRAEDRQRNRGRDHERRAPISQEKQNH